VNIPTSPTSRILTPPVTMEDLMSKIDQLLDLVVALDTRVDGIEDQITLVDAHVSELSTDYGTGFGLDE
jgi:hypothetical protein